MDESYAGIEHESQNLVACFHGAARGFVESAGDILDGLSNVAVSIASHTELSRPRFQVNNLRRA